MSFTGNKCSKMFYAIWVIYIVGLMSPVLVDASDCNYNQRILAKVGSTATFDVNFTQAGQININTYLISFQLPGYTGETKWYNLDTVIKYLKEHSALYSSVTYSYQKDARHLKIDLHNVSMKVNGRYKLFHKPSGVNSFCIQYFNLFILNGPSDIKLVPGKKRHVLVGGDILPDITCTSECNPPCKITWGKHGEGNKLSLGAVTTEDAGEYTCTATRDDGQAVEQTISVFVARSSPHLVLVPEQITYNLDSGDTMPDVECKSDCSPPCKTTWGKHGAGNILSLGAVTTDDTGEYTCTATRSDGRNVQTSISISVTDKTKYVAAITSMGTIQGLTIIGLALFKFVISKGKIPFCSHKENESKENQQAATVQVNFSTTQGSGHENYEVRTDNQNKNHKQNLHSEVTQDLKVDMTEPSTDNSENTIDRK